MAHTIQHLSHDLYPEPGQEHATGVPTPAFHPTVAEEDATVLSNMAVNAQYWHLVIQASPLAAAASPGQFYQLQCPPAHGATPYLRRPMSLYGTDPATGQIQFLYKVTGSGTRGLSTLVPSDTIRILGPLGKGYDLAGHLRHIVVIGRGVGLATLAPLAEAAHMAGIGVTAILSARSPELIVSADRFNMKGMSVIPVTDTQGNSDPAWIEQALRGLISADRCDALFTCGSSRLLRMLRALAVEFDLPGQVALEQQMACGLGMCFCCVRDFASAHGTVTRRVCLDGPVFDIRETLA